MTRQDRTTIAIFGGNPVVGQALSVLLKSVGYDTRLIERDSAGITDGLLDGVDLVLLAPGLSDRTRNALLSVVRDDPRTAQMLVLTLSSAIEEVLNNGSGTLLVPWPSSIVVLDKEIEAILASARGEEGWGQL